MGFGGNVHRAVAGLVLVEGGLGGVEFLAHLRHLLAEELQALGRFGRVAGDVLLYIALGDFLQHLDGLGRIGVLQAYADDAGLLAALTGGQACLIVLGGGVGAVANDREGGAGAGVEFGHGDAVVGCFHRFANHALGDHFAVRIAQDEAIALGGFQGQLFAVHFVGHDQVRDAQCLAAPGVGFEASRIPAQLAFLGGLEVACHEAADQREMTRFNDDVEVQRLHGAADHGARFEQGDFRLRGRDRRRRADDVGQARQAALGFDLDHRGGHVDRRAEQCVGNAQHREEAGYGRNGAPVVEEGVEEMGQVNVLVLSGFIDRAWHGGH